MPPMCLLFLSRHCGHCPGSRVCSHSEPASAACSILLQSAKCSSGHRQILSRLSQETHVQRVVSKGKLEFLKDASYFQKQRTLSASYFPLLILEQGLEDPQQLVVCFLHGCRFYTPTILDLLFQYQIHIKRISVGTEEQCRHERISLDHGLGNRDLRFNVLDVRVLLHCIALALVVLAFLKNEQYRDHFKNSCCISRRGRLPWQCCLQYCSLRISRVSEHLSSGALWRRAPTLCSYCLPQKTPGFR